MTIDKIIILILLILVITETVYIIQLQTRIRDIEELNAISEKSFDKAMQIIHAIEKGRNNEN